MCFLGKKYKEWYLGKKSKEKAEVVSLRKEFDITPILWKQRNIRKKKKKKTKSDTGGSQPGEIS